MKRLWARVRAMLTGWRLGGAVTFAILLAFGAWFFFFRGGGNVVVIPPAPPPRPAVGQIVTLAEYQQAVKDALDDVQSALNASGDERKADIKRASADLEGVEGAAVTQSAGGTTLAQADNTLVLAELQKDNPNLEAVESSLSLLSTSLGEAPTTVTGTLAGAQATSALAAVLSDPLYDYTKSESPVQKLMRWLAGLSGNNDPNEVLTRLMLAFMFGLALGSITFLAIGQWVKKRWARLGLSVLSGLLGGILFYMATGYLDLLFEGIIAGGLVVAAVAAGLFIAGLNRASAPSTARTVSDLEVVLGMGAGEARKRAVASAAEQDFRAAIRYRCLAVLLALDEAHMLVFDRSATNREYLFRAPGPIHDSLQALLSRFEAVWYGNSPTNAEEWTQYDATASEIEAHIAREKAAMAKAA